MTILLQILKGRRRRTQETKYRTAAKGIHQAQGRVEVHDDARVHAGDRGAWVQAWVWVDARSIR